VTSDNSACNAWPSSWNSVRASSKLSNVGSRSPPLEKFITLTTSGRMSPASFSWSRSVVIQAPLRWRPRE